MNNKKKRIASLWLLAGLLSLAPLAWAQNTTSLPSIPDYFKEGGLSRTKGYENQAVNEAVDNFSGRLQYHFTDLFIPGNGGMDLAIQRSYNAIDDPLATPADWSTYERSPVGLGWTMHMGRVIRGAEKQICSSQWAVASANPVFERADGNRQVLYEHDQAESTMWITKDFWRATCQSGAFHVQSPDGTTYEMTEMGHSFGDPGSLQRSYYAGRIVDRNGNWIKLDYVFLPYGTYALSQITTSDGRSVSLDYTADSTLSTITDNLTGRVWRYTVASGPGGHVYLNEVQRPDGLSWKYAYHANTPGTGSMSRIEYPSGGSIDYVYDHVHFRAGSINSTPSTVLKQKTVKTNTPTGPLVTPEGLADVWTWNYEVASEELPRTDSPDGWVEYSYNVPPPVRAQVNVTTVTDPLGKVVEHFHLGINSVKLAPKHIGIYIGSTSDSEYQSYAYHDVPISAQEDVVGSMYGNSHNVSAKVMSRHWRGRIGESFLVERSNFDAWGNPASVVETGQHFDSVPATYTRQTALSYEIDTSKWLLRQVKEQTVTVAGESHTTTRQFDGQGNVRSQSVAGVPTSYTYHPSGDLATQQDALGRTVTFSAYKRGIASTEVQPEGVTVQREVDQAGNVVAETNARGATTNYTFDSLNRLTRIARPLGNPVEITWAARSREVSRGGMRDVSSFDGLGRLMRREVSAMGQDSIAVDFLYDALGRQVFQSYPNSSLGLGHDYDTLGRPTFTYHRSTPDRASYAAYEQLQYGNLRVYHRDPAGSWTINQYRAFGDPNEQQTMKLSQGYLQDGMVLFVHSADMSRNVQGQLTRVEQGGAVRSYGYDPRFYLVSSTEPESGTTVYGRDAVGNLTSLKVGALPETTFLLDGRNRVTEVHYPDSENTAVSRAPDVTKTYYPNDLLKSVASGGAMRQYTYDLGDKLLQESLTVDDKAYALDYAYNDNEALASLTYPSGRQVQYNPDGFGRATAALPYLTQVAYHPNGMPSEMTYANGVSVAMGLNARQWPSSLAVSRPGASNLVQSSYEYDHAGNLLEIDDAVDSVFNRSYAYDSVHRLREESLGNGLAYSYGYDERGNLLGQQVGSLIADYSYDTTSGRLSGISGRFIADQWFPSWVNRSYEYDTVGNVISDGRFTFGYDRANNLRCTNCGQTSQVNHEYDGAGMRVKSTAGGVVSYQLYSQQGLLVLTDTPGVERKELYYLGRRQVAEHRTRTN
ncbi:MAG: hypothetical protein A2W72_22125 [Burkholderiales bacterium RIFCSPLOWO2_12_67_14]|nr:MAG: hypothetical protein A3I64_06940 [Burkholderiales bacterium RIFCSPLOWO2_02_FULL_67_64]OGB37345.1 MAG: hypothetical protein A3E51_03420 [Burkholderiales bacterium RIFCSPHIGHO2_12_FULL_67_38]OGB41370.1 MAG: hypothetical protein A2W72_22125 [Burkholderiales bacterium RIFCSPLOWO2_12_67_14]OGB89621.1 MAG: hypothetical protein A3G82_08535 [Burkholderiales bacterium RIFCSPLOWO2_12_FULL_67_210]